MNSSPVEVNQLPQNSRRSQKTLWWSAGGGLLAILLVVAAVIIVPRVLQAQRVASYSELVSQINIALTETHELGALTDRVTVLYALQIDEARVFQPALEGLAGYSDHYFSEENLAALAQANEALLQKLLEDDLTESEAQLAEHAKDAIETHGFVWQTDFLNLSPDAVEHLLELNPAQLVTPIADEAVTDLVIEEAHEALLSAAADKLQAASRLTAVEARASALLDAVAGALHPLENSALGAPEQATVVIGMYPNADARSVAQLNDSAKLAAESVSATAFTFDDDYRPVPVSSDASRNGVEVAATDAWRAVIIATHLSSYSEAITAAWITDAGGFEQALGFNPFLPFFPF